MTQTSTATQTPTAATLRACTTREQAATLLRPLKRAALAALAATLDMRPAGSTKATLIDRIVQQTVGARLTSAAIHGL